MNTSSNLRLTLLSASLAAALSAHATTLSDFFPAAQAAVVDTTTSGQVDGPASPFAFGPNTTRRLSLINVSNAAPGNARSRIGIDPGVLSFSNDAAVQSNGYLTYDFLSPTDLTGSENATLRFLSNDHVGTLEITTLDYNGAGNAFDATIPVSASAFSITLTNVLAGVDKTRMRGIAFDFLSSVPGENLRLASIQTAPEPGTWAALGLGAVALLRRRRRA